MAEGIEKRPDVDLEEEVWAAISAFQQILQAMPNDRASLEALAHAFEQIGDHTQARDYLVRLGTVLLEEGDVAAALELVERLHAFAQDDPRAMTLVQRIEKLTTGAAASKETEAAKSGEPASPVDQQGLRSYNLAQEMSMAWNLMEAKEITEEQYAAIVQDLTEMSAKETAGTTSVLHVLEGRGFKNLERIINFLSRTCSVPYISLASFDLRPEATSILPMDFMVRRAAMVFELLGKAALVVVLNPYDQELRKQIGNVTGRVCHFFITLPSEFDKGIDKISEVLVEKPQGGEASKPSGTVTA